jgi:hypothetical protein
MSTDRPPTDAEMDQFFELVAPALAAGLEAAWAAAAGRPLTPAEVHTALQAAFDGVAGDAIREMFGADVAALYDGRRPS